MPSVDKKSVEQALKTAPPHLTEVLRLRQQLSKSSVKKYTAMENCVCKDSRAHGMFQFYGANRTGRWSGRLIQLQNLAQNHMTDLAEARSLIKTGDFDSVSMLYDNIPVTLSELIRTAFVPEQGRTFLVADFSAIEARVIAWVAGEKWRMKVFAEGGDIYCASASQMFKVPVEKHGENGHLRQKGKQAELACIAEGSLVLTDKGLIPIQDVKLHHKVWDGEEWVNHEGVVYRGEKEVIEYEGLTATPDHLVWVEGENRPIYFGFAPTCGSHLLQTGDGGRAIWMGENNQSREKMEQIREPLLCPHGMYGLWECPMAESWEPDSWCFKRLPKMFSTQTNSTMARQTTHCSKTEVRKSQRQGLSQLRGKRDWIRLSKCDRCRTLPHKNFRSARKNNGSRQNRYKRKLCSGQPEICKPPRKLCKSTQMCPFSFRPEVLAVCTKCCSSQIIQWSKQRRDHSGCRDSGIREKKKLATNRGKARVYDIRNAGGNHRFTVSNVLVHNCGYGGSKGALISMGALDYGMKEEELQPLVYAWREANPNITKLWWDVDRAAKDCVKLRATTQTHGIKFSYQSGFMFITLPSGRKLAYVRPRIGENKFGGECVTYEGVGESKKWLRLDSYGPKFVENIVQAIARDLLMYSIGNLSHCRIVAHVHDELIIESEDGVTLDIVCQKMGEPPPWAKGLLLGADGYECLFYKKD